MDLHDIVDDAHALASSIESGEIDEAVFRAGRIAETAAADEALKIVLAAHRVMAALATRRPGERELGEALSALARSIEIRMEQQSGPFSGLHPDSLQLNRRGNLRAVLNELEDEGIASLQTQARFLRVNCVLLEKMLNGGYIPEVLAREVEWVMQRRTGWMDEDPYTRDL